MLGYLLARAGIEVLVLDKYADVLYSSVSMRRPMGPMPAPSVQPTFAVALVPTAAKARRLARFVASGWKRYSCDQHRMWPEQSACRKPRRSNRTAR